MFSAFIWDCSQHCINQLGARPVNDRKQQVPDQIAVVSTATGSIELAYQEFGDGGDPVFLLITGWFSDLTLWPRGFCKVLAERGYRVIRYDNRDAGLSTRTVIDKIDPLNPPYTMSDLAGDAIGLLDALDVEQAHVAGFAFGGTISHLVAIEHPQRILSLVPLATASGARVDSSGAPLTVLPASIRGLFGTPFPEGAEELDQHHKRLFAAMAGSSFDEVEYDDRRKESALRGAELARGDIQSVVGTTTGDRTDLLVQVDVPVLVVHPEKDPLVSHAAAMLHTEAFRNGRLLILDSIGHGVLPQRLWATLADAMNDNAKRR
jgi:pimeloyl-ACP methyl ester carboxylesterase